RRVVAERLPLPVEPAKDALHTRDVLAMVVADGWRDWIVEVHRHDVLSDDLAWNLEFTVRLERRVSRTKVFKHLAHGFGPHVGNRSGPLRAHRLHVPYRDLGELALIDGVAQLVPPLGRHDAPEPQ